MKPDIDGTGRDRGAVTPYAGVWIETFYPEFNKRARPVTPYAGVWIETTAVMREVNDEMVTPYAGVWIETHTTKLYQAHMQCHSLRGSVD